jgi:uncharacterized phiE125 gp8 family phage protein
MVGYGSLTLAETSPVQSFTEPLTLSEVKKYLNLPERSPTDSAEDDMISGMITAAREEAETQQGRDLVEKQWDLSLDYFPCEIRLRSPLQSVDLVKYRKSDGTYTTLTADVDYIIDAAKQPGRLIPVYSGSWPSFTAWPSSAVTVRYTSGYSPASVFWSDSGKRIRQGMLMLISEWYNNRIPMSYDLSVGGTNQTVDRIMTLLRTGRLERAG